MNRRIKVGSVVSGSFYRVGEWSAPRNATVQDVLDYAAEEEGNDDIRHQANAVIGRGQARQIPARMLLWVTRTKKSALRYGDSAEIETVELDGTVLAEDGDDGFLILNFLIPKVTA